MTAAIILYDHVHPNGAFDKKSAIDVKGAIKLLLSPSENNAMLNALRYTTKTINDETTQKSIKQLLEVK
jgi:Trp operon repressor